MSSIKNMINKSTAVILVGGKSSRMGYKDKYSLKFKNQRFIDCITEKLDCFESIIISVNQNQDLDDFKYKSFVDEIKEIGPIGGIYTAMNNIENDILFICTCDMPNISKELVYELYSNFDYKYDCIIATINGKIQPLFGIYQKRIKDKVKENIDESNYKIKNLLDKVNTKYIDFNEVYSSQFLNINTIEEYKNYCKIK